MILRDRSFFKAFLFFILPLHFMIQEGSAQEKTATIQGNLQPMKDSNFSSYYFSYKNLLNPEEIIIPIAIDQQGNFIVTFPILADQQIALCPILNDEKGQPVYSGTVYLNFFVKPGQNLSFAAPFNRNLSTTKMFKGTDGLENNQYLAFKEALQKKTMKDKQSLFDYGTAATLKRTIFALTSDLSRQLTNGLAFHKAYFKKQGGSDYIKAHTKYQIQYEIADFLCSSLKEQKDTSSILSDFLLANKISIEQPAAFGNIEYNDFLNSYYRYLTPPLSNKNTIPTFTDIEFAQFVYANTPNVQEKDRAILKKIIDSTASDQEFNYFSNTLTDYYITDYLGSLPNNNAYFDYFIEVKDPFIRDLFSSRVLYGMMKSEFSYIKSNLPVYQAKIRDGKIKDQFLSVYARQYKKIHASSLSPKSNMINTDDLSSTDIFKTITEKYKGKTVYLDIWATWCAPCLAEMENAKLLRDSLKNEKDIVFVYICTSSMDKAQWKNLLAAHQIEGENYYLNMEQSSVLNKSLNIKTIPHYVLLNKKGEIVANKTTTPGHPDTITAIKALIAK